MERNINGHQVLISQMYGIYMIYLDGEFYCSCDSYAEVRGEIEAIRNEVKEDDK